MSPGRENSDGPVLFTQSTSNDYEKPYALDVLGPADTHENDQQAVYKEFTEQLESDEARWYQTSLPWKGNHATLPTYEASSKRRLEQLIRRLKKNELYEEYDAIIQEQLQQGVVEPTSEAPSERVLHPPQGSGKEGGRKHKTSHSIHMTGLQEKTTLNPH